MMSVQDGLLWKQRKTIPEALKGIKYQKKKSVQKQGNLLDEFLEDVCDDFCRIGNFAPGLVENVGIVCNIPGIPY